MSTQVSELRNQLVAGEEHYYNVGPFDNTLYYDSVQIIEHWKYFFPCVLLAHPSACFFSFLCVTIFLLSMSELEICWNNFILPIPFFFRSTFFLIHKGHLFIQHFHNESMLGADWHDSNTSISSRSIFAAYLISIALAMLLVSQQYRITNPIQSHPIHPTFSF